MRCIWLTAVLGLVGGVSCMFADEVIDGAKTLKRQDARRAVSAYEETVKNARANFDRQVEAARKQLLVELEAAQAKATRENQLDEAVTIRELRKSLQEKRGAAGRSEIQIITAFYGQNVSWLDV